MKKIIPLLLLLIFSAVLVKSGLSISKIIKTSAPDFSVYYYSAKNLLNKKDIYSDTTLFAPLNYPPVSVLLFIPFLLFNLSTAQLMFTICSFISVFLISYLSLKITRKKVIFFEYIFVLSLSLIYFPTKFTLGMGQINLVAYLFLLLGFYIYKNRFKTGGFLLAIAYILKPILGFTLIIFLLNKNWKMVKIIFFCLTLFTVLSIILFGFSNYYRYFSEIFPGLLTTSGRDIYYNQGITGFISRLTDNPSLRTSISLIGSLLLLKSQLKVRKEDRQLALSLVILVLIDTLSWQHHFVFLIYPFIYSYYSMTKNHINKQMILLIISFLLVAGNISNPILYLNFPLVLILSHGFFGALFLYFLIIDYCQG